MRSLIIGSLLLSMFMLTAFAQEAQKIRPPAPAHGPVLIGEDGAPVAGVRVAGVDLHAVVHGQLAQATMVLTFANSQPRVLGGNLVFPLPEGATVTGYGLDINGVMVDGVAVEKERARMIYETEIHKRVDPGLVEHVAGNEFRTRLYPIPANGSRSIKIEYVTQIEQGAAGAVLSLPLGFADAVDNLTLRIDLPEAAAAPTVKAGGIEGLAFVPADKGFTASMSAKKAKTGDDLVIGLGEMPATTVAVERRLKLPRTVEELEGHARPADPAAGFEAFEHYFLITEAPIKTLRHPDLMKNHHIGVVWDASLSRAEADHARELKILEAALNRLGNPGTDLVVLRNDVQVQPFFAASADGTASLIAAIKALPYDGATNLGALILPKNLSDYPVKIKQTPADCDLFLLFTDGYGNLGADMPLRAEAPVFAMTDDIRVNHPLLREICQESGGSYLNLKRLTDEQVLAGIGNVPLSLVSVDCDPKEIADVNPPIGTAADGRFTATGRLLAPEAKIKFNFGYGRVVTASREVTITAAGETDGSLLPRFWAQQKVAALSLFAEKNGEELSRLGKQFNLVTPTTSLLVLETSDQYVQYRVVPPMNRPEIYRDFMAKIEGHHAEVAKSREQKLQQVVALWNARVAWWEQEHKYAKDLKASPEGNVPGNGPIALGGQVPDASVQNAPSTAPSGPTFGQPGGGGSGPRVVFGTPRSRGTSRPGNLTGMRAGESDAAAAAPSTPPAGALFDDAPSAVRLAANDQILLGKAAAVDGTALDSLSIAIKAWDPNTPYIQAMKDVPADQAYGVYLEQRKAYSHSPAFYFDCADYFVSIGQKPLGVRVLTNIVELELQDARLLRVAAHRLNQIGERELAIDLFEKVLRLRPEEPQSYRDLALALADRAGATTAIAVVWIPGSTGNPLQENVDRALSDYSRSLELLNKVVLGNWDRFPEVELPVLMEANDIAAKVQRIPGIHDFHNPIDARLQKNLDLDVRVVLTWDADQTDIDLWVTEPSGEKCFYGHNRTIIGGLLSHDFTDGYGPEEYCLRKTMPGKYVVQANYFGSRQQELTGPATVQATVITNFGRPNEKRKSLTIRLKNVREVVDLGTVTLE